jgi:hypothetical protein
MADIENPERRHQRPQADQADLLDPFAKDLSETLMTEDEKREIQEEVAEDMRQAPMTDFELYSTGLRDAQNFSEAVSIMRKYFSDFENLDEGPFSDEQFKEVIESMVDEFIQVREKPESLPKDPEAYITMIEIVERYYSFMDSLDNPDRNKRDALLTELYSLQDKANRAAQYFNLIGSRIKRREHTKTIRGDKFLVNIPYPAKHFGIIKDVDIVNQAVLFEKDGATEWVAMDTLEDGFHFNADKASWSNPHNLEKYKYEFTDKLEGFQTKIARRQFRQLLAKNKEFPIMEDDVPRDSALKHYGEFTDEPLSYDQLRERGKYFIIDKEGIIHFSSLHKVSQNVLISLTADLSKQYEINRSYLLQKRYEEDPEFANDPYRELRILAVEADRERIIGNHHESTAALARFCEKVNRLSENDPEFELPDELDGAFERAKKQLRDYYRETLERLSQAAGELFKDDDVLLWRANRKIEDKMANLGQTDDVPGLKEYDLLPLEGKEENINAYLVWQKIVRFELELTPQMMASEGDRKTQCYTIGKSLRSKYPHIASMYFTQGLSTEIEEVRNEEKIREYSIEQKREYEKQRELFRSQAQRYLDDQDKYIDRIKSELNDEECKRIDYLADLNKNDPKRLDRTTEMLMQMSVENKVNTRVLRRINALEDSEYTGMNREMAETLTSVEGVGLLDFSDDTWDYITKELLIQAAIVAVSAGLAIPIEAAIATRVLIGLKNARLMGVGLARLMGPAQWATKVGAFTLIENAITAGMLRESPFENLGQDFVFNMMMFGALDLGGMMWNKAFGARFYSKMTEGSSWWSSFRKFEPVKGWADLNPSERFLRQLTNTVGSTGVELSIFCGMGYMQQRYLNDIPWSDIDYWGDVGRNIAFLAALKGSNRLTRGPSGRLHGRMQRMYFDSMELKDPSTFTRNHNLPTDFWGKNVTEAQKIERIKEYQDFYKEYNLEPERFAGRSKPELDNIMEKTREASPETAADWKRLATENPETFMVLAENRGEIPIEMSDMKEIIDIWRKRGDFISESKIMELLEKSRNPESVANKEARDKWIESIVVKLPQRVRNMAKEFLRKIFKIGSMLTAFAMVIGLPKEAFANSVTDVVNKILNLTVKDVGWINDWFFRNIAWPVAGFFFLGSIAYGVEWLIRKQITAGNLHRAANRSIKSVRERGDIDKLYKDNVANSRIEIIRRVSADADIFRKDMLEKLSELKNKGNFTQHEALTRFMEVNFTPCLEAIRDIKDLPETSIPDRPTLLSPKNMEAFMSEYRVRITKNDGKITSITGRGNQKEKAQAEGEEGKESENPSITLDLTRLKRRTGKVRDFEDNNNVKIIFDEGKFLAVLGVLRKGGVVIDIDAFPDKIRRGEVLDDYTLGKFQRDYPGLEVIRNENKELISIIAPNSSPQVAESLARILVETAKTVPAAKQFSFRNALGELKDGVVLRDLTHLKEGGLELWKYLQDAKRVPYYLAIGLYGYGLLGQYLNFELSDLGYLLTNSEEESNREDILSEIGRQFSDVIKDSDMANFRKMYIENKHLGERKVTMMWAQYTQKLLPYFHFYNNDPRSLAAAAGEDVDYFIKRHYADLAKRINSRLNYEWEIPEDYDDIPANYRINIIQGSQEATQNSSRREALDVTGGANVDRYEDVDNVIRQFPSTSQEQENGSIVDDLFKDPVNPDDNLFKRREDSE